MKKITVNASKAFWDRKSFSRDNTSVFIHDNGTEFALYGNCIASLNKDQTVLAISSCGWYSNTTKERLNGVLDRLGYKVYQKNFKWYVILKDGNVIDFKDGMEFRL